MLLRCARNRLLGGILALLCALNATHAWSALDGADRCPPTCPAHSKGLGCHGAAAGKCPHHQPARRGLCAPGCQHTMTDVSVASDPAVLPAIFASSDAPLWQAVSLSASDSVASVALDPPFHPPRVTDIYI
ncbi:MAG TPA: hypothetical protein VL403_15840 [Candidatus Kryptonia bacterium]|nr:hypothetical protein [Candidatus Kryptonia bacterium]